MMPSARLITMKRYPGVVRRLGAAKNVSSDVQVAVESVISFEHVFAKLREPSDLARLDGHGWQTGRCAYFGTATKRAYLGTRFTSSYVRDEHGAGIVAPIVVLAFCEAGKAAFPSTIAQSIDRSHVAFLASTDRVAYDDAERIYPLLFEALAELGSDPDPIAAFEQLRLIAPKLGSAWRAHLLSA